jgi:hypothetical protein
MKVRWLTGVEPKSAQDTEAAGAGDFGDELRTGDAAHAGLEDGNGDAEKVGERSSELHRGPHESCLSSHTATVNHLFPARSAGCPSGAAAASCKLAASEFKLQPARLKLGSCRLKLERAASSLPVDG